MDWEKSKNILLVSFLTINIILLSTILVKDNRIKNENLTSTETKVLVEKKLKENNISVKTSIPKLIPRKNTILVQADRLREQYINELFFNNKAKIYKDKDRDIIELINNSNEKIIIDRGYKLIYLNKKPKNNYKIDNNMDAILLSEKFLIDKKYKLDDMTLTYINYNKKDKKYTLIYTKIVDNIYIEDTYTKIIISEKGVEKMERFWVDIIKVINKKIYMQPAYNAVLDLIYRKDFKGEIIEDIDICYYFKLENLNSDLKSLKFKARPSWRIISSSGEKIILD